MIRILCPWCKKKGVPASQVLTWEDAEKHLKGHGATKKQLEQAWQQEIAIFNQMQREALEDCL